MGFLVFHRPEITLILQAAYHQKISCNGTTFLSLSVTSLHSPKKSLSTLYDHLSAATSLSSNKLQVLVFKKRKKWSLSPYQPPSPESLTSFLAPHPLLPSLPVLATHAFPAALQAVGRSCKAKPQPGACMGTGMHLPWSQSFGTSHCLRHRTHVVPRCDQTWRWGPANSIMWQLYLSLLIEIKKRDEISSKVGPEHMLLAICIFIDDATHLSHSSRWRSWTICSVTISKPIALVQRKKNAMWISTKSNTFLPSSLIYTPALCMGKNTS